MRFYIALIMIIFSTKISAQTEWKNFAAIENIKEVEIYDNRAYVTNNGGLLIIDLATGEEELLIPDNSTFEGSSLEIEMMSNGNAWVASTYGLMYFDGKNFKLFEGPDTINFARPQNLTIYNDELWFLDFYGKVYSIKDMILIDHSAVLPEDIEYFDLDSKGNVWVLTRDEGFEYDGSAILSSFEIYPGDEVWQLDDFYIDTNDGLWMPVRPTSTGDLELAYIDAQGWHVVKTHYRIKSFFESDSLGVCFNHYYGFGYINNGILGLGDFNTIFSNLPLDEYGRTDFLKWDNNDAWFSGTLLDKPLMHRYVDNELEQYGRNTDFLGDISDIEVDCQEVLYKASESFIEKFMDDEWKEINPDYSSADCRIEHLEINPFTCELWGYSTRSTVQGCYSLWKFDNEEFIEFDLLDRRITHLAFSPAGEIYILGNGELSYIDTFGIIHPVKINSSLYFTDIFISSRGMIWVLGQDFSNPCFITDIFIEGNGDGKWTEYHSDLTQINTSNQCNILENENGDLWFSSHKSLIKYDGVEWTKYMMEFDFQSYNDYLMDEFGNFWMASDNEGLVYWDREKFTYYNIENSDIFSNTCEGLKRVGNDLWVEHNFGLSQMKIDGVSSTESQSTVSLKPQLTLYPNPSNGPFSVQSDITIEKRYDVYSISGAHLLSEVSDKKVWSSTLDVGVYLVKVTTPNGEFIKKLIVQ